MFSTGIMICLPLLSQNGCRGSKVTPLSPSTGIRWSSILSIIFSGMPSGKALQVSFNPSSSEKAGPLKCVHQRHRKGCEYVVMFRTIPGVILCGG